MTWRSAQASRCSEQIVQAADAASGVQASEEDVVVRANKRVSIEASICETRDPPANQNPTPSRVNPEYYPSGLEYFDIPKS